MTATDFRKRARYLRVMSSLYKAKATRMRAKGSTEIEILGMTYEAVRCAQGAAILLRAARSEER